LKATGIVRRIDELGRIVIPKEIRRTMRIREGDPLEIFVQRQDEIILKKYSPIGELSEFAQEYADALNENTGLLSCVVDRDVVIVVSGGENSDYTEKTISADIERAVEDKQQIVLESDNDTDLCKGTIINDEDYRYSSLLISPIISEDQPLGAVVIASFADNDMEKLGEIEIKLAGVASSFLGKQMED